MAADAVTSKIDMKTVVSVIVAIVIVIAVMWLYNKYMGKPDGGLTEEEFKKLTAEQKLLYKKSGDYYVKA